MTVDNTYLEDQMHTIVVVGGGYAGLICANRVRASLGMAEAARTSIRMLNPTSMFYERIRLHEVAAGSRRTAALPLRELLHPDVELILGTAVRIDPAAKEVVAHDTEGIPFTVAYDQLVYAVGSGGYTERVAGATENAYVVAEPDGAAAASVAIAGGGSGQHIVVVGGGFTGVETAAEVAQQHPEAVVTLVTRGPLVAPMRSSARASITRRLARLGVKIDHRAYVSRIEEGNLVFADGAELPFDVCVWAASFSVPDLARASGLACDEIGRLRVDKHLRSIDTADILGAGDAVRLPDEIGSHLRMSCAAALPLGGAAAQTIIAQLRGDELPVASVGFLLQCISIGRYDGYIQVVGGDDTVRPVAVAGRTGAMIKEAICRMTVNGARKESTKPGSYWAPQGPKPRLDRDRVDA